MRVVSLTIREWFNFKAIAKFMYKYTVCKDCVQVEAEGEKLESLGF